jgi:aerobic carbon-monoxide dehydrogenase medium subunit
MYPAAFEYHTPGTVDEAVTLLKQHPDDAKLLAGGHSLLPMMKLRFATPKHLVDIRKIPGLSGIREIDGAVLIGATTTHYMLESSDVLRRKLPMLAEAAHLIGDPLVRNMGTIGGSLAHSDPSADLPAVIIALGAELKVLGTKGTRTVKSEALCTGLMTTCLGADEVITEIRIPDLPAHTGTAYVKHPHPASRFAVVGIAAALTVEGKTIKRARIGITGLGTHATRATAMENALTGKPADESTLEAASRHAADGIDVREDLQGSVAYKTALAARQAMVALTRAAGRVRD